MHNYRRLVLHCPLGVGRHPEYLERLVIRWPLIGVPPVVTRVRIDISLAFGVTLLSLYSWIMSAMRQKITMHRSVVTC